MLLSPNILAPNGNHYQLKRSSHSLRKLSAYVNSTQKNIQITSTVQKRSNKKAKKQILHLHHLQQSDHQYRLRHRRHHPTLKKIHLRYRCRPIHVKHPINRLIELFENERQHPHQQAMVRSSFRLFNKFIKYIYSKQ